MACYVEIGEVDVGVWDDFGIFEPFGYASIATDGSVARYDLNNNPLVVDAFVYDVGIGPGGSNDVNSATVDDLPRVFLTERVLAGNTHHGVVGPAFAIRRVDDPTAPAPSAFVLLQTFPGFGDQPRIQWGFTSGTMYVVVNTTDLYSIDRDTGAMTLLRGDHHGGLTVTPDGAVWGVTAGPTLSRYDPVLDSYATVGLPGVGPWSALIPRPDNSVSFQMSPHLNDPAMSLRCSAGMVVAEDACMIPNTSRAFRANISSRDNRSAYHSTSGSGGGNPYPAVYRWLGNYYVGMVGHGGQYG